ncbi:MAG TPA: adenylate/guanylate cyclase domain-containing protein [Dehalococcoidia bacterium]|nr:adenylate/guanylate cyclase domain-containing protein [Dehalococcoidia bacterium]
MSVLRNLPSGTVTFLFTDIEGSTKLLRELGEAYAGALAEHRRVLREAFARHDGFEVGTEGDAFFVVFRSASEAAAATAEAQSAVQSGPVRASGRADRRLRTRRTGGCVCRNTGASR